MRKKKILISLIIIIAVVILVCVTISIFSKYRNSTKDILETAIFESTEKNIIPENEMIETPITKIAEENIPKEENKKLEDSVRKVDTAIQKVQTASEQSKIINKEQSQVKQETQTKVVQTQPKVETETKKTTQTQTQQTKVTEEKNEIINQKSQNTTQGTKEEEKYLRNDAMINRIKQIIQSNESEYMKTYGYTIVVDSSIKQQANQFTFTENRVKSYITYRFGTIKVYAEDYYKNGQLIMTECYIY